MGDETIRVVSPLARDEHGVPVELPTEAIAYRVRRFADRPGRPPMVWTRNGPLHIALDTTLEQLRRAVDHSPARYLLYPVNRFGCELSPIVTVEVEAERQVQAPSQTANEHAPGEVDCG